MSEKGTIDDIFILRRLHGNLPVVFWFSLISFFVDWCYFGHFQSICRHPDRIDWFNMKAGIAACCGA